MCTGLATCLDRGIMSVIDQISNLLMQYPLAAHVYAVNEPKSSGGTRPIAKPNKELKKWLRAMKRLLDKQFPNWPEFMHGGIKNRSYVSYARPHCNRQCVVTVDIKACFDTITQKEISSAIAKHLGLTKALESEIAQKLCFGGKVPQGFPTSNFLCNLYLLDTLQTLHDSFKKQHLKLGNYVDDIVVSGTIAKPDSIVNEIATELSRAKLKMNKAKVKIMPRTSRQMVCGLLVNKRLSLTRPLKARLLSEVSRHKMGGESLAGWLLNLNNVDVSFAKKLRALATKRGYTDSL